MRHLIDQRFVIAIILLCSGIAYLFGITFFGHAVQSQRIVDTVVGFFLGASGIGAASAWYLSSAKSSVDKDKKADEQVH